MRVPACSPARRVDDHLVAHPQAVADQRVVGGVGDRRPARSSAVPSRPAIQTDLRSPSADHRGGGDRKDGVVAPARQAQRLSGDQPQVARQRDLDLVAGRGGVARRLAVDESGARPARRAGSRRAAVAVDLAGAADRSRRAGRARPPRRDRSPAWRAWRAPRRPARKRREAGALSPARRARLPRSASRSWPASRPPRPAPWPRR